MYFTRRLPERRFKSLLVAAGSSMAAMATMATAIVSCSSNGDVFVGEVLDAQADAPLADGEDDAAAIDAGAPIRDSGKSDASPRSVACAGSPCATSLVTTLDAEGFCALLDDETVACWGQNDGGQLGRGEDAGSANSGRAARVVGLANVASLEHTCAIATNGEVWCWGTGPFLRSADVPTTTEPTPVKLDIPAASKLAIAGATGCAVVASGVLCWGANANGQVAVPAVGEDPNAALAPRAVPLPSGGSIRDIALGNAAFVLRADDTAVSWGRAPPLGRASSLSPDPYPVPIALAGVYSIAIASDNACAVVEGVAHCWGSPLFRGLYDSLEPLPKRELPAPVATPEPVVQIATTASIPPDYAQSIPAQPQRACATGVSGAVYCWGGNGSGQAGDGTTNYAHGPVKVEGLPAPAAEVKTTPRATCALLTNGKVFCWGDGFYGQLGDGKPGPPSLVPKEVSLP